METKLGQFTKLKCREGSRKICQNDFFVDEPDTFLLLNQTPKLFFGKTDLSMNS